MEHVRQNQNGEFVTFKSAVAQGVGYIKGFLKAVFLAPFSNKTFGDIMEDTKDDYVYNSFVSEPVKKHEEYTVEQRGQIVEDYAKAKLRGTAVGAQEKKAQQILKADPGALEK